MAATPQQRTDTSDDLGTTPSAPQSRTDDDQRHDRDVPPADRLNSPVTVDEIERRQLDDEADTLD